MQSFTFHTASVTWVAAAVFLAAVGESRGEQRVLLFNQESSQSYAVTANGTPVGAVNSSSAGVVSFTVDVTPGQIVSATSAGSATAPGAPVALAVTGDDVGCAHATWGANPEPDVTGYRLYYGPSSSAGTTDGYADSVDVTTPDRNVCGLMEGTYYFAVRAFNAAGLLGGVSNEVSASVSTGNAQPPLPPLFVAASEDGAGCLTVSWVQTGDPTVTGYMVDYGTRSVENGDTNQYDETVDVGGVTQYKLCGLTASTYYVAIRAKNNIELLSAYSTEQSVQMSSTPVSFTSFDVSAEEYSVLIRWKVWSDESLDGIEIYRKEEPNGNEMRLPLPGRIDPGETRFVDDTVKPDADYTYRVVVVATSGERTSSFASTVHTKALALALEQNSPNPFNPTTKIAYVLPYESRVRLDVFDVRGSLVATLHDGRLGAGRWSIWWDGVNRFGKKVATGTYFYRLRTDFGVITRKMILVK